MPAAIDEIIKRRVVQQWLSGDSRAKIAIDNDIGEGTVTGIVAEFKIGLDNSEFDSARELALQAKKQGLNLYELCSNFRLHNFIISSGASENEIEAFIANVSSGELPPEKVVELVNELFNISNAESIPFDQVSAYISEKLEEKKKIDEEVVEADALLQKKNVSIESINEHIQLNEELKNHGLSIKDIHKLLNLLLAAKEYKYDPGKIVAKLRKITRLENKENKLKSSCDTLSREEARYKDILPFTEELVSLGVGIQELIGLEIAIKEAAKMYNSSFYGSTVKLIDDIKSYSKINGVKKELQRLSLQKYALDQACSCQGQSLIALARLKSHGVTEEQIISFGNMLQGNQIKM